MKLKIFSVLFVASSLIISCNSNQADENKSVADTTKNEINPSHNAMTAPQKLTIAVDNKKDPVCGMPVKAGIADTFMLKDKIIGFCCTECKNEFATNPAGYIEDAEMIK